MKIRDLREERDGERARVVARVEWETAARSPLDVFFETEGPAIGDLAAEPNALLAACFLPAVRHREERIALEGPVCPVLAEGLATMTRVIESWGGAPRGAPPRIEAAKGFRAPLPRRPMRAAALLSGGIDSLHLLTRNRADHPEGHPDRFRDALAVFGLYSPEQLSTNDPLAGFDGGRRALAEIAGEAGVALVPVATNVTALEPDWGFLADEFLGSALVSTAHLFARRWDRLSIASGRDVAILTRRGSHPLIDPCLSSGALQVRHVGTGFTRWEKLREIGDRDAAGWRHLVVCMNQPPPPYLNCGRCEKCLRTMTGLEALGRLSDARQFPDRSVSAEMIRSAGIHPHVAPYWRDFVAPLRARGRDDLADAVEAGLGESERLRAWFDDRGWKGRLRKIDRRLFGGRVQRAVRRVRARA